MWKTFDYLDFTCLMITSSQCSTCQDPTSSSKNKSPIRYDKKRTKRIDKKMFDVSSDWGWIIIIHNMKRKNSRCLEHLILVYIKCYERIFSFFHFGHQPSQRHTNIYLLNFDRRGCSMFMKFRKIKLCNSPVLIIIWRTIKRLFGNHWYNCMSTNNHIDKKSNEIQFHFFRMIYSLRNISLRSELVVELMKCNYTLVFQI